ncbi:AMP-binding protein [Nakamurella sp. YIM 132087]|uniref:AMP-binding protein n=1 Tax=Nakamurella alba TaxID=2665158 RepID=A0A7K1FSX4_9ACTN|nr:AMP-binding protein [Nakamurella alba]
MQQLVKQFLDRAAAADHIAVIDDSGPHPASEIVAAADDLAAALGDGVPRTVLVQADNSWRTLAATVAVGRAGGVIAVVNRHTTAAELADAFDDIRPDAVVVDPSAFEEWQLATLLGAGPSGTALDGWTVATTDPAGVGRWSGGGLIGLTSGSTGRAKGVVQSGDAIAYAGARTIEINDLRPGDPIAAIVPLSSTAAFCFGIGVALQLGGPLVTASRWRPDALLERMGAAGVRWVMCVPTMALQLGRAAEEHGAGDDLASMTVGGGPMDLAALQRAETALHTRILRVFGMSECLGHTSPLPTDPVEVRLGRDGRPFPGTEVRGVDTDGLPVPEGEVGRAQVRGPSLFLGYARAGRLHPVEVTADGWFPTGDLVRRNGDGTISIMGREKDVIIRGGRNIDVLEVETAVASHPGIESACVVPLPDPELGERIGVLVVTEPGHPVALPDLLAHLGSVGLSKTKWPEYLFQVEALPQTRVGKLSRPEAKDLAARLHRAGTQIGAAS